ncbi:STAS domain-containing protein [Streptomyces sp. ALI-76-A]|jgi:anti-sigma B factor antagonist|uniref:STAS domain-containing protein n=1 Tax=Streptomyces sp. ALI-76-A TaxID=3025736 RepID=UPI00256F54F0|nr:STAS domain-containing protein [Streptomyces sp. ALI-76-A]MDL5199253.1 STAS domain-containing protein [Streptomyces sp. ALI-76-A]
MSTDRPASQDRQNTLEVHVRALAADRSLVTATGALDVRTAVRLSDALQPLLRARGHTVLADLSGVTFMDSTGLTCLIGAYRTARSTGAHLALIAPSERVRHMLALTGTDQVLPSHPTLDSFRD